LAGVLPIKHPSKVAAPMRLGALRGEADFLTTRAEKLAPNSEEVKKVRDEVLKLLELKTN